jgi:hypothetical protein
MVVYLEREGLRAGLKNDQERRTLKENQDGQLGGCRAQAFVLSVGVIAFAACASEEQTVQTEPDPVTVTVTTTEPAEEPTTEEETTTEEAETTTEEVPEDTTAGLGDSITLAGNESGLQMRVTLVEVRNDAEGDEFFGPERGNRFFAVRLRLTNVGSRNYNDSPSNGASVIDRQDQEYTGDVFDAVEPALGSPTIRQGDSRQGWITFQVPKRAKLRTFQLTLDSGFGPETGEWVLR